MKRSRESSSQQKKDSKKRKIHIPDHFMKDILETAEYKHRGAESAIFAKALCILERRNKGERLYIQLISLDPRIKTFLSLEFNKITLNRIFFRPDLTEDSYRMEIYIDNPSVVFKNLLYYEIDVEKFVEDYPLNREYQDPCVQQMLSNSPTSMLQERIRNMVAQRRPLTLAEKDFTEILRKYPLKKRSSHGKKSLLSMPRIISESFLVGSSRGGGGGGGGSKHGGLR